MAADVVFRKSDNNDGVKFFNLQPSNERHLKRDHFKRKFHPLPTAFLRGYVCFRGSMFVCQSLLEACLFGSMCCAQPLKLFRWDHPLSTIPYCKFLVRKVVTMDAKTGITPLVILGWGSIYVCWGLNSHYFPYIYIYNIHIIGDGHQPNSRRLYTHYKL